MVTKNIKTFLACCLIGYATNIMFSSCEDILEMDSDRQVFDPALDQKTDSIFYIIGTLQGLQQAIDQYVLVNELRGDLLAPTQYADSALTQLYNYTATTANKYDSAYVYYRVINNCNYYVAHRDTTLRTGSRLVALQEYAEALAIRAWSYMQLAKTYGTVPFYTEPLNNISQADNITATRDIKGICDELAPELQKFVGTTVPDYGTINASSGKTVQSQRIMFPVDLVLADLYLEAGRYQEAAQLYFGYLRDQQLVSRNRVCDYDYRTVRDESFDEDEDLPADLQVRSTETYYYPGINYRNYGWADNFLMNLQADNEIITYMPMAVNKLQGVISTLPAMFGYNQFAGTNVGEDRYYEDYQLAYSDEYKRLADSQLYYYLVTLGGNTPRADSLGDMRRWASLSALQQSKVNNEHRYNIINKLIYANVPIYRTSVIYLRLAECLNRMGYPDAAFAVLKDGLGNVANTTATSRTMVVRYERDENDELVLDENGQPIPIDTTYVNTSYIEEDTYEMLTTTLPILTQANRNILGYAVGIHSHGCGYTAGNYSLYQYYPVVYNKLDEMSKRYGVSLPNSVDESNYKQLFMEAVEDLICDEYALEAAFEGHRFGDLCRMARHKNEGSIFGSGWGGRWLNAKLAFKNTGVDFTSERNWYLPFK